MAVEEINAKLFQLLKDELTDLNRGRSFNQDRIKYMKELCRLIIFLRYIEFDPEVMKILSFYD